AARARSCEGRYNRPGHGAFCRSLHASARLRFAADEHSSHAEHPTRSKIGLTLHYLSANLRQSALDEEMDKPQDVIPHVITESGPFGGSQRNTLLTLKGLVRDGYKTDLICGPGGRLIPEAQAIGVPVHVVPDLVRQVDPLKDSRALLQLYRLFRS